MKKILVLLLCLLMLQGLIGCTTETSPPSPTPDVTNEPPAVSGVSDEDVRKLQKLCKVWGFTKYTHKAFITGEKDWDEELLALIPVIRGAEEGQVNDILYEWYIGLGGTWEITSEIPFSFMIPPIDESDLRYMADTAWIDAESYLGEPLSLALSSFQRIWGADNDKAPVTFDYSRYSNFSNEKNYINMNYSDESYRLLGLFRLWNAMEYYFPYRDILDRDWNELLLEYIPKMLEESNKLSYELTVASLASNLRDAHVDVMGQSWYFIDKYGAYSAPVLLTEAEGRLVVTATYTNPHINSQYPLRRGDIILRLNGIDIDEVVRDMLQYVPYPNDEKALLYLTMYFDILSSHERTMEIDILRDNIEISVSVNGVEEQYFTLKSLKPSRSHLLLDDNIGLINPAALSEGEIHTIMKEFADTDGLIVDLRQYPGTVFLYSLADYFLNESQHFVTMSHPSKFAPGVFIDSSGYSGPGFSHSQTSSDAYFYDKDVVILMNEQTISQPELTIMSLRNGPNVTVIGSNSIGADGLVAYLTLPGGLNMKFTGLGVYTPEGGQTQRIGLSPDIYVKPTIEGIRDGRDELMEAAIEFLLGR